MQRRLRISVIGCGPISERHLTAWEAIPETEVVALCDRHPEHFNHLIEKFGKKETFTDFAELLKTVDCDIVDIATRPYSHKELVYQAAEAGKNILCQKPFAPTLAEAREMIEICEDRKIRIMVYENWRWFLWFQVIKRILSTGEIGELKYAKMISYNWLTIPVGNNPPPIYQHPQTYLKEMKHLLVYEAVIHLIDVFRFLFGEAHSVYAQMQKMSSRVAGEDYALIILTFEKMQGTIDASWCSREPQGEKKCEHMLIEGTKGSIILKKNGQVQIIREGGEVDFPEYDWKTETKIKSHIRVHRHFIDCILNNCPFQTDARDNIKSLEIVLKSYESAAENKVIKLQGDSLLRK